MKEKIQSYLKQLEKDKGIKILLAVETGSRAWGFPSPDSDYDVRIIYVHPKDWYISLNQPKDTIEIMLEENEIDITGWELKKALQLLRKSNASFLERIQSPIIYYIDNDFKEDILKVSDRQYSRIATIHHYLSMSKKFIHELEAKPEYKLKKFFYALRSASVCKWILEKNEIPPIEFHKIYNHISLPNHLIQRIDELIAIKNTVEESYLHQGEEELLAFIKECIKLSEENRNTLTHSTGTTSELNQLLLKYIDKYDD